MKMTIKHLPAFAEKIARLSRRAERLGLPPITYTVSNERAETCEIYQRTEEGHVIRAGTEKIIVHDVELHNVAPVRLNGWSFAAVVETLGERNLIRPLPGIETPARYLASGCICEHCQTNRARLKTYLLQHENGREWRQVGSTCLADFIGHASAENVAAVFAFYGELYQDLAAWTDNESALLERGGARSAYDVVQLCELAVAIMDAHGFTSGQKARDTGAISTADRVRSAMKERDSAARIRPSEDQCTRAAAAVHYFANLPAAELQRKTRRDNYDAAGNYLGYEFIDAPDTYLHSLQTICRAGFCSWDSIGLAVSIPAALDNHRRRQERAAALERQRARAQHVGKVGERVTVSGSVARIITYETEYGLAVKAVIEDTAGNVWFGSAPSLKDGPPLREGERVTFSCAIKEHGERDGIKQNRFQRPTKAARLAA